MPFTLGITVYDVNAAAKADVQVTVRNESSNDTASADTGSDGKAVFQLANVDVWKDGWKPGNICSYYVLYSGYEASGSFTLTDIGGAMKTLTLAALPTAPSLRYFTVQEFLDHYNLVQYDDDNENGIKPEVIVKVGQSIESDIDDETNRRWDNNNGSYYTATQEYHNADGSPSTWPSSIGAANLSSQHTFFTKNTPIQSLTTFQVNKNAPNATADWTTLTADDNELKVKNSIGRIEIVDSSDYPAAGKDQVRITYQYGESSVPSNIRLLAILMTGRAFGSKKLQQLNIKASEASGLSSAIQNLRAEDDEINRIIEKKRFTQIRRI